MLELFLRNLVVLHQEDPQANNASALLGEAARLTLLELVASREKAERTGRTPTDAS